MMEKYNINQTTLKIISLYMNDYRASLHLREIAREINIDVKAVQLQLKKLETVNIFSSILKGRNKEYHLNLDNVTTSYYLVMAEAFISINFIEKEFLIKKIIGEIRDKVEGTLILFGSFAKGEATVESDVDLFVITDKTLNIESFEEVGDLIGRKINVKSTNRKEFQQGLEDKDPLLMEVILNHIVLKGIDNFCELMWRHYAK